MATELLSQFEHQNYELCSPLDSIDMWYEPALVNVLV